MLFTLRTPLMECFVLLVCCMAVSLVNSMYTMPAEETQDANPTSWSVMGNTDWQYVDDDDMISVEPDSDDESSVDLDDDADVGDASGRLYDNDFQHNLRSYLERKIVFNPFTRQPANYQDWHRHVRGTLNDALHDLKNKLEADVDEDDRWKYSVDYSTDVRLTAQLKRSDHNTLTLPIEAPLKRQGKINILMPHIIVNQLSLMIV